MSRSTESRTTKPGKTQQTAHHPVASEPRREAIEARAYAIYLARGGADGHDQDDWLQAERDLRDARSQSSGSDA